MSKNESNPPFSIDEDKKIRTNLKSVGLLVVAVATFVSGFFTLEFGLRAAQADATDAKVKAETLETKLQAEIQALRDDMRKDHDTITRIDENVKFLVKERQK